ncbi:MAG: SPOR domain-containing protein [Candidatus Marinimicrobia bacterium]|nr:SPOR domain-containing protein [Candidatus Neomarinimicrobiota bacterium]
MIRYILIIFFIFTFNLYGQDFSSYKKLIDEGKMEEVQKSLEYLNSEYPNHPFILYLKAAINSNGEEAIEQFKAIINDHPNSTASELSIMKIGEYLYAQGLYTQAGEQLKKIPLYYTESKDIERAVNLMKKSLLAIGEQDSVDYYIEMFSNKYPELNFTDYDYYSSIILQEETPMIEELMDTVEVKDSVAPEPAKLGEKPWVVQVGAFKEKKNADVIVSRLESAGYNIEVVENSSEMNLYLVQIVRFDTIEKAIIVGEDVRDQFGIEFRILERN